MAKRLVYVASDDELAGNRPRMTRELRAAARTRLLDTTPSDLLPEAILETPRKRQPFWRRAPD